MGGGPDHIASFVFEVWLRPWPLIHTCEKCPNNLFDTLGNQMHAHGVMHVFCKTSTLLKVHLVQSLVQDFRFDSSQHGVHNALQHFEEFVEIHVLPELTTSNTVHCMAQQQQDGNFL